MTKSTLVVRDRTLLAHLAQRASGTVVWITITTLDRELARSVEPGTPPPKRRLQAVCELGSAGVPVGVLMAPVLPGLTDTDEALAEVFAAAAAAGAWDVGVHPLRLCDGAAGVYRRWLSEHAPHLTPLLRRLYPRGSVNATAAYRARLDETAGRVKRRFCFPGEPSVPGSGDGAIDGRGCTNGQGSTAAVQLTLAW